MTVEEKNVILNKKKRDIQNKITLNSLNKMIFSV